MHYFLLIHLGLYLFVFTVAIKPFVCKFNLPNLFFFFFFLIISVNIDKIKNLSSSFHLIVDKH